MSEHCSAKQVAEAVCIWSYSHGTIENIEFEDIEDDKCLDIFLSTLMVFNDVFRKEMGESFAEFMEQMSISKKSFIDFLKPRALLLTEKNGYFDFVLVCTYFFRILMSRRFSYGCFHLARVACKLLTRILEDRFGEIFETDAGWESLMLYCRNIHAAVYPSEKNRPPGYVPYFKRLLENIDENKSFEQIIPENDPESNEMFIAELLGLTPEKEESSASHSIKNDSSDSESITNDTTYWNYFTLDQSIFCGRLTHSDSHLKDVYNLLKKLKQDIETKSISVNEFDISISDDEYIEQLEDEKSKKKFSDFMRRMCAKKICKELNEKSGATTCQDKVCPEDITEEQIQEFILKEYYDEPQCDLCDGKMRSFTRRWEESFREKYSNCSIVTELI